MILRGVALVVGLLCAGTLVQKAQAQHITTQVVDVLTPAPPNPPVIQQRIRYLLVSSAPAVPQVAAILFAGGDGYLKISDTGAIGTDLKGNFLVRVREQFALNGIAVAVVDAPDGKPLKASDRLNGDYARAMTAVIADLRKKTGAKKIWLIGTSSGTLSATSIAENYPLVTPTAAQIKAGIDPNAGRPNGIVLTASQTKTYNADGTVTNPITSAQCGRTVFNAMPALSAINVPVFVSGNSADKCPCSPSTDMALIIGGLSQSPTKASKEYYSTAGTNVDICSAYMPHGFYSIEKQVVVDITDWVKTH